MALPNPGDSPVLLHNPRCSKSRAAKTLLEERSVPFEVRAYLEDPLAADELQELARRLKRPPSEWTRTKEAAFADAGLQADAASEAWIAAIAAHPILMERPILVTGDGAAVGRPPEEILALV